MNKHLKCFLKFLGLPLIVFTTALSFPFILLCAFIDMTGCIDTQPWVDVAFSIPDWYKGL